MGNQGREFEGKSLDLAVWTASQELGIEIDKMRYKILDRGVRGTKPARILVLGPGEEPAGEHRPSPAPRPPRRPPEPAPEEDEAEDEEAEEDLDDEELDEELDDEELDDEEPDDEEPDDDEEEDEEDLPEEDDEDLAPIAASGADVDVEADDPIEEARHARRRPEPRVAVVEDVDREADEDEQPDHDEDLEAEEERPRRSRSRAARSSRPAPSGPDPEELQTGLDRAREMLPPLVRDLGMELDIDYELQEDHVYIPMDGDDGEFLLGERGEGLNALQFLLNKMVYRGGPARLVLDVNGYRKERQDRLIAEAKEAARQVRETGRSETLGPMNPFERRLIHLALRDDPDVTTVSHGDSFLKRVEITTPRAAREGGGDRRGPSRRRRRPRHRGGRR